MFCTQNQLITEHAPVYPYEAVIRLKLTVSIRLTAVNITAVNSQVWGLDGTGVLPVQPYRTNRIVQLRCAALRGTGMARAWLSEDLVTICQPRLLDVITRRGPEAVTVLIEL